MNIKRDLSMKFRRVTFSVTENELKLFKNEALERRCTQQELFEEMFYQYFKHKD